RPHSPQDWHMAYCQSQFYVQHLKQKYGEKIVGEMLAAYRDGLDTGEALKRVCKVEKGDFEKGYQAFLEEIVKGMRPVEARLLPEAGLLGSGGRPLTFTQLKEAYRKDPNNPDLTARLAEQYLSRDKAEARKLALAVLAQSKSPASPSKSPASPRSRAFALASYVLARLEEVAGNGEEAKKLLEGGLESKT